MDQMTVMKGVAHSDKPREIYHKLCSSPQPYAFSYSASFSSLFWFYGPQLHNHQPGFQQQQAPVFNENSLINPLYTICPAPNSRQTKSQTSW